jgi:hypothetical protein
MDPLHMLLANLLVQVAACFIARQALVRSLKSLNHCVFADQGNPREGWSPDPLTQALTDLKAAKEQITEQKETIARMDDHFLTRREFSNAFTPVRNVVYGMVGIILSSALASILLLIWKSKP